ncbi:sugar phosphate isomerase/epimerase family protein [Oceanidesulfovibrio marinus]|uniref:Sugar phosphate isomerase/epimerase n=1 Tax=Oceanidesulfovibrio marinus TaxID=370038 RepID=A0A6P1ZJC6_9BACT|nr:sugar phosphate isomerase/epimerase family protein [Oceanidesulfovibrio marinus]TVM35693.1 sugar phosphate isomerase/epimerase [Oceanidesulfovibrio marinus]
MYCFLALPLKRMAVDPNWLEGFLEARILFDKVMSEPMLASRDSSAPDCSDDIDGDSTVAPPTLMPEIGIDAHTGQRLGLAWCRGLAARLEDNGLECAVHLPFLDLHPASLDNNILLGTRQSLERAIEFASLLSPSHLIAHSGFDPGQHKEDEYEEYLGRSKETWLELLRQWHNHPPLHIENTYELDPEPLRDLVTILHSKKVGICFDAGHWNSFSRGSGRRDMDRWLKVLAPYIRHLHLHDNDGTGDLHLGVGTGNIPWQQLTGCLRRLGIMPGCTLEPRGEAALRASLSYLRSRQDIFGSLMYSRCVPAGRRQGDDLRSSMEP